MMGEWMDGWLDILTPSNRKCVDNSLLLRQSIHVCEVPFHVCLSVCLWVWCAACRACMRALGGKLPWCMVHAPLRSSVPPSSYCVSVCVVDKNPLSLVARLPVFPSGESPITPPLSHSLSHTHIHRQTDRQVARCFYSKCTMLVQWLGLAWWWLYRDGDGDGGVRTSQHLADGLLLDRWCGCLSTRGWLAGWMDGWAGGPVLDGCKCCVSVDWMRALLAGMGLLG